MRNRCLSVENQHMVNFSSAVRASVTSQLTGELFQRRRETALKIQILITTQQKTEQRGVRDGRTVTRARVPRGWTSALPAALGHRGRSPRLWQKWQHANVLITEHFEFCCSSLLKWPDTIYLTTHFKS